MTYCKNCNAQIHKTMWWSHVRLLDETTCSHPEPLFSDTVQQQVLEFHRAGGHVINTTPTLLDPNGVLDRQTIMLRVRLIDEEILELVEAMEAGDLRGVAKELADLLYVVYGTAISYGIDMEPVSRAVHQSNMTKFGNPSEYESTCDETGKSIRDGGGKTLKPSTYVPPDLSFIKLGEST